MSNPVNHSPVIHGGGANGMSFSQNSGLPSDQMNTSVVAVEQQRAIAEAQGQLVLAKKFPRNTTQAREELLESCSYMEFAEEAFYALPRGGQTIRGPSIRMAEEIARCYGNFQYGHRELARNEGESVVEVYAWDVEKNNRSTRQITIPHIMDTRQGGKKLTTQKEIADYIANVASKQMRSRILALLPKPLVAAAVKRCEQTLAGTGEQTIQQRVEKMMALFAKYGVTVKMLESYLKHPLTETTTDELTDLIAVYTAVKDGQGVKEFFTVSGDPVEDESTVNVKNIIKRNNDAAGEAGAVVGSAAGQKVNTQPIGSTLTKPQADTPTQGPQDPKPDVKTDAAKSQSGAKGRSTGTGKNNKAVTPETKPEDKPEPANNAPQVETQQHDQIQDPQPEPDPIPEPDPVIEDGSEPDVNLTPPNMDDIPPATEEDYF